LPREFGVDFRIGFDIIFLIPQPPSPAEKGKMSYTIPLWRRGNEGEGIVFII